MQRHDSTVSMSLAPGRALSVLSLVRTRTLVVAALATLAGAAAAIVASAERDAWLRRHPPVPNLVGVTVAEGARLMWPLHFGLSVNRSAQHPDAPMGVILVQNPPPGHRLAIGSIVQVTASQGSGIVPGLRGEPVAVAARKLEAVGLRLGRVFAIEDSAPPDTVLEQFTPPGRRVDPNSPVDVLVSGLPNKEPVIPEPSSSPAAASPRQTPVIPGAPGAGSPAVPRGAVPASGSASRVGEAPTQTQEEGSTSAGASSGQCAVHPERERVEVCHEPESNGGAQPNVYGSEHRGLPTGP